MLEPIRAHRLKGGVAVVGVAVLATAFGVLSLRGGDNRADLVAQSRGSEPSPPPAESTTTSTLPPPSTSSSSSTTVTTSTSSTTVPRPTTTTVTATPVVNTTATTRVPADPCLGEAPHLAGPGIWTVSRTGEARQLVAHDPTQASMRRVHWSPDGQHAAYVTRGPGGGRLRVVDLAGRISAPAGDQDVSDAIGWTADSRRVLYATERGNYPPPSQVTVKAAPIDGGAAAVVWEGQWAVLGIQSIDAVPDGRIVFINEDRVFSVHENGTAYTELERIGLPENGPHHGVPRYLKVSPDGTKVAVAAGGETGIIDLGTGKIIAEGPAQLRVSEWSADSRWAAFIGSAATTVLGTDGSAHTIPAAGRDVTFDPQGGTIAVAAGEINPHGPTEHLLLGPLDGPWQPSITHTWQVHWGPALVVAAGRVARYPGHGDQAICVIGDSRPLVRLVGAGSPQDLRWVDSGRLIAVAWH